jgi:hypothetical protein
MPLLVSNKITNMETLYRISTSYFCAGLIVQNNKVIKAAPILGWTVGLVFNNIKFKSNYYIEKINEN